MKILPKCITGVGPVKAFNARADGKKPIKDTVYVKILSDTGNSPRKMGSRIWQRPTDIILPFTIDSAPLDLVGFDVMDMETKHHPTHKRTTYSVAAFFAGAFIFSGVLELIDLYILKVDVNTLPQSRVYSQHTFSLAFFSFLGVSAWLFFRAICCKCPKCKHWIFRTHDRKRHEPRQFYCVTCNLVWNTDYTIEVE